MTWTNTAARWYIGSYWSIRGNIGVFTDFYILDVLRYILTWCHLLQSAQSGHCQGNHNRRRRMEWTMRWMKMTNRGPPWVYYLGLAPWSNTGAINMQGNDHVRVSLIFMVQIMNQQPGDGHWPQCVLFLRLQDPVGCLALCSEEISPLLCKAFLPSSRHRLVLQQACSLPEWQQIQLLKKLHQKDSSCEESPFSQSAQHCGCKVDGST